MCSPGTTKNGSQINAEIPFLPICFAFFIVSSASSAYFSAQSSSEFESSDSSVDSSDDETLLPSLDAVSNELEGRHPS